MLATVNTHLIMIFLDLSWMAERSLRSKALVWDFAIPCSLPTH